MKRFESTCEFLQVKKKKSNIPLHMGQIYDGFINKEQQHELRQECDLHLR